MHRIKRFNENVNERSNYMFFLNLKSIKDMVDSMIELDETQIDNILKEHDWASAHITSAADDITEVYNFMNSAVSTKRSGYMDFDEPKE